MKNKKITNKEKKTLLLAKSPSILNSIFLINQLVLFCFFAYFILVFIIPLYSCFIFYQMFKSNYIYN